MDALTGKENTAVALPKSRLGAEQAPLGRNGAETVAAAGRHTKAVNPPIKPHAQKSILGVSQPKAGAGAGGAQPGKRMLLGVSRPGAALPASMLFGNGFQVPKLSGK